MDWLANKTFKRLKRIFKYAEVFYSDTKTVGKYGESYLIEFHSALGDVRIEIKHFEFGQVDYELSYANYAGSTVFSINANTWDFDVTPLLNDDLSGHDVDLAVLELEEYLFIKYGDIDKVIRIKEKEEKEKLKRHKKELRVLEK